MTEVDFSIVIPAYNYAEKLSRAVASACSQPGDDYDVLVINDGSTDHTPKVLAELVQLYPKLRVISQSNAGLSSVRNRGIEETNGRFLIFLDADDELLPNALSLFRKCHRQAPSANFLIGPTLSIFPDGREVQGDVLKISDKPEELFLDYLYKRLRLSNGAVAMGRGLFKNIRYNPGLSQTEDIPVFAQCLALGRCAVVEAPTTKIHKHAESMRHNVDSGLQVGMSLVDEIFNPDILPALLMQYKDRYRARRALSLFRLCYRGKRYQEARQFYRIAWGADWRVTLEKPENILKWLRCFMMSPG